MKIISATIDPLKGKYYGTRISIKTDHGDTSFEVWFSGDHKPSTRELAEWGDGEFVTYDSHFESADCLELCERIVAALTPPLKAKE